MCEPECPDEFVTKAELFAAFEQAGVSISEDQLARWRGWALLPPVRQIGLGRPGGSKAFYPKITIDQAIEAKRLFGKKRDKEFVGFELWWLGFDVDQQYWRPIIQARSVEFSQAIQKITVLIRKADETDENDYPDIPKSTAPKPIRGISRNIPDEDFSDVLHMLINAIVGVENSFDTANVHEEVDHRPQTLQTLIGFSQAETDQILGAKIQVAAAFNSILKAVSSTQKMVEMDIGDGFFESEKFQQFLSAKNDVRNAFEIARNLHVAFSPIYGPHAFGLKAARWFHDKAPPELKAELAWLWMCAREEHTDEFYSSSIIEEMLEGSREAARLSVQLEAAKGP